MYLKLSDVQMEEVTLLCLEQYHHDLKTELKFHELDPYLSREDRTAVLRSAYAVYTIMQDLMSPSDYAQWKLENGVEL